MPRHLKSKKKVTMMKIRGLLPCDIGFITSTWMNTYKRDAKLAPLLLDGLFFNEHNRLIHDSLDCNKVLIACDPEDKEHVFGYLVGHSSPSVQADYLHYIYVKSSFRQKGIAAAMIQAFSSQPTLYNTHETLRKGILTHLKKKYQRVIFNPYAFMNPQYLES